MFIHFMYVDILFPLTKVIPIMFERVITHYETLEKWIDHDATRYHNFNALPHAFQTHYHTFSLSLTWIGHNAMHYHDFNLLVHALLYISFSLAWFGAIFNALPRVIV